MVHSTDVHPNFLLFVPCGGGVEFIYSLGTQSHFIIQVCSTIIPSTQLPTNFKSVAGQQVHSPTLALH